MAQAIDRHYPGTPGTPLYIGVGPPPSGELRLITTTAAKSTVGAAQTSVPFSFGQPFADGDFNPSTESLYAKVDDVVVPVQIDQISTRANGTARFGVVCAIVPSLASSGSKAVSLYAGPKETRTPASFVDTGWDPVVVLTIGGVAWTATPRAQLLANIASNTGVIRNGPAAKEVLVSVPFKNPSNVDHAHLRAYFHVRMHASGGIRTDMVIENGWLLVASPGDVTYSAVCTQGSGGSNIWTQSSFTHHHHARWRKTFWTGTEARVRPVHDMAHFLATRATWNYNRSQSISSSLLSDYQTRLNASNTGPMGPSLLTQYMPGTGGREEIAPVPMWAATYLITQDDRVFDVMIKQSEASASAPMHFRDEATGNPTISTNRPDITFDYGTSSPTVPRPASGTGWTVDRAHQGSYNYVPYLVTGDYFHLEELTFWASYNTMALNPGLMGPNRNLFSSEQVRGQAWATRSILEATYATPDNHPLRAYFRQAVDDNAAWQSANYGVAAGNTWVSPLGGVQSQYDDLRTPDYQADFFALVWSWAIENGETAFATAFNNTSRYAVGRFSLAAQTAGFCTSFAAHSWTWTRTTPGNVPITTWAGLKDRNHAGESCGITAKPGEPAYPDQALGYAAVARAALAAAANAGHADAPAVYTRWKDFTPLLDSGPQGFSIDPSYAIVPR